MHEVSLQYEFEYALSDAQADERPCRTMGIYMAVGDPVWHLQAVPVLCHRQET